MSIMNPDTEKRLQQAFKKFNPFMLFLWRLGLGPWVNAWPQVGGRIMVVTHVGRKSGFRRRTPVNYTIDKGEIYCTAGFGAASDWYRNIIANPEVEVWLPGGWWYGLAEDISDSEDRLSVMRKVLIGSGFAAYAAGINPFKISDQELAQVTASYRLVHIHRTAARTGPDGPGDLAWIWPLTAFILLPLVLTRRKD